MTLRRALRPTLAKIGVFLMLLLPSLLCIELAILRTREKIPGQQVVVAPDGSLQLDPHVFYDADPTIPAFGRFLFPFFVAAFLIGIALLVISFTRWMLMRRRMI